MPSTVPLDVGCGHGIGVRDEQQKPRRTCDDGGRGMGWIVPKEDRFIERLEHLYSSYLDQKRQSST